MKKFILITKSESGDDYTYFIEHPQEPTSKELKLFLQENANDIEDDEVYENVERIEEIPSEFQTIPKK